ncbi:alginate lyase family protein [Bradyrhizobium sp. CCBAU 53421]|uniref:alginate lyase family protein n=1 Tax=Bradyrhizobium sp. CCBAU 53421 TaxID=1325120 RepID=UPI00188BDC58|nr:alginate lyase family protein [Bradyrhizobium sp. CCBAU 53421]QOZ37146.1 poly(beta-D-mannuronate) lyase [Bradyrhizobium sp. CCBAU 53421]
MKRWIGFTTISVSIALPCLGQPAAARTCEAPPALASVDPPGFYQDAGGYAEAIKPLHAFIAQVNKAADEHDQDCVLNLLASWARGDALLTIGASYQGDFERSWAGTDFALALLRFPVASTKADHRFQQIKPWLIRIAEETRDADRINHLGNNLVYWAGLDLMSIGTLTDRSDLIDAGISRARQGIGDIGAHGELQRELKRGERALHYHNFALIPLVFCAELASRRKIDLYAENNGAIHRLADPIVRAVQDERSFGALTNVPQQVFPWTFQGDLAWMEPYYARFHDQRLPPIIRSRRPFNNPRLGGNVTASWGAPQPD